tara:strand:- start:363 stop:647 length:285 start_codon:yes stop_codon:yes gene_type:complete
MANDYVEYNVVTGEKTVREHTQAEKDAINAAMPTTEQKWKRIRQDRNQLLKDTDYAALSDSPAISDAMTAYRKALRDLPASESNPDDIVFPDRP